MQKTTKLLVVTALPVLLLASNVFAASLETTLNLAPNGYRDPSSYGGEFTATLSGNTTLQNYILENYSSKAKVGSGFETFCVEMNEVFTPGDTYSTTLGSTIQSPAETLSAGAAYLYSQFAQGTLNGYNYTPGYTPATKYSAATGRELSADELQDAVWYLMGEINSSTLKYTQNSLYSFSASTDPFVALAESICGTNGAFASDASNNYGVQVLELTCANGLIQDQLVYCPVPEPATLAAGITLLLPLGISAIRTLRKTQLKEQEV